MTLLAVNDLQVRYRRVMGTVSVSFNIAEGEVLALVGSNGAGKSSTLKAILGMVTIGKGSIAWMGQGLSGLKPNQIMRRGIGYSPEGRRVFTHLTVEENLYVGGHTRTAADNAERI